MESIIRIALAGVASCVLSASGWDCAHAQAPKVPDVIDQSYVAADGTRVMRQSVVVPARVGDVWAAFTTSEGFATWAAPVAHVDLRLGGIIETSYDPKGRIGEPTNIRNEIVAFVPQRMLAIRNTQAPPSTAFDVATFQMLHTVVFFEPIAPDRTLVTIAQPGYGASDKFAGVYKHFERGNAWSLGKLAGRFADGPVVWMKGP